jgi:hypothetical protein
MYLFHTREIYFFPPPPLYLLFFVRFWCFFFKILMCIGWKKKELYSIVMDTGKKDVSMNDILIILLLLVVVVVCAMDSDSENNLEIVCYLILSICRSHHSSSQHWHVLAPHNNWRCMQFPCESLVLPRVP